MILQNRPTIISRPAEHSSNPDNGVRMVINFQKSNDPHGNKECVYSVWDALESRWYSNKHNYPYPTSNEPGPEIINHSPESFGIIVYIESFFSKWCPFDNIEWIYEY